MKKFTAYFDILTSAGGLYVDTFEEEIKARSKAGAIQKAKKLLNEIMIYLDEEYQERF